MGNMKRRSNLVWLILWLLIYVAFLTLEIITGKCLAVTILKYSGLVVCFLYVLIYAREDVFLVLALLFTLVADGILAFDNISESGVLVFILVQSLHLLRFSQIRRTSPIIPLLLAALVIVVGVIQKEVPLMFVLAIAYGVLIFTNIYEAYKWHRVDKSGPSRCALFGFILFFLCDLSVGISYLTTTATWPHTINILTSYFAWVFYLPAQVLIALSGRRKEFKTKVSDPSEIKIKIKPQALKTSSPRAPKTA